MKNLQLAASQYQDNNHGDHGAPLYSRIMKLKEANPNLKVLISIGGWFAKSTPFNKILMTDATRRTFIENALNFIRHWKFDGLGKNNFIMLVNIKIIEFILLRHSLGVSWCR